MTYYNLFFRRRKNPLLSKPPRPKTGLNRAGGFTISRIESVFTGYLPDEEMVDLYKGTHTSPSPFVAIAYALKRMLVDVDYEFDEELEEAKVVLDFDEDIPILIGIDTGQDKLLDVDALTYAHGLVHDLDVLYDTVVERFEEYESEDFESFEEFLYSDDDYINENIYEASEEMSHSSFWDDHVEMVGIAGIAGDIGNRPHPAQVFSDLKELIALRYEDAEEWEIVEKSLMLAKKAVPQSRFMEDIEEDEVAVVLVVPPYKRGTESRDYDEDEDKYLVEPVAFNHLMGSADEVDVDLFDRVLLEEIKEKAGVLYLNPDISLEEALNDFDLEWHGTSFRIGKKAFPELLGSSKMEQKAQELARKDFDMSYYGFEEASRERRRNPRRRASRKILLFSFGSNNPNQLAERLGVSKSSLNAKAAFLEDHWRVFRGHSNNWGGATASFVKKPGYNVYGYVAELTEDQLDLLDRYEGALMSPPKYKRTNVKVYVRDEDGDYFEKKAVAYKSTSRTRGLATTEYKKAVAKTISTFWTSSTGGKIKISDIPDR